MSLQFDLIARNEHTYSVSYKIKKNMILRLLESMSVVLFLTGVMAVIMCLIAFRSTERGCGQSPVDS